MVLRTRLDPGALEVDGGVAVGVEEVLAPEVAVPGSEAGVEAGGLDHHPDVEEP